MNNQRESESTTTNGVQIRQSRRLPDFLHSVNLKHVKLGYHYLITHLLTLCLVPLMAFVIFQAFQLNPSDIHQLWLHLQYNLVSVIICSAFLVFGATVYFMTRSRSLFLVDYACYKPPSNLQVKFEQFMEHSSLTGDFDDSSLEFQRKILERSGLGEETYVPEAMHYIPPRPSMAAAREEAQQVMFGALDVLFANTNIKPKDIGILVVNCSLFNPTPSLSAMIVNKYKLRGNVRSFNLGGMGCSAGVIAVDLAKDMLQVHRNTYAVVIAFGSGFKCNSAIWEALRHVNPSSNNPWQDCIDSVARLSQAVWFLALNWMKSQCVFPAPMSFDIVFPFFRYLSGFHSVNDL
ncbi:hypothetical protein D5086_018481 [Populus alba]|uniref:Uncharacterized protein n=1 Tax=Populus alba TaxID=43335 RepID=A0ACC4BQG2_POPAL